MTYLYAGLGIAMMSAIAAMIQIGNNLNNISPVNNQKKNAYLNSVLPSLDKKVMKYLYSQNVPDQNICDYLKDKLQNSFYEDGEIFLITGTQTPSNHEHFKGSCALVNKEENHRIIITSSLSENYTYALFSCYLQKNPYCDFEINK